MEQVKVESLSYAYDKAKVLQNISFSVEKGSCVCIAGANGSGKSTLLELLASCMKPSSGSITIGGGHKTGLVFQNPDNQFFMPSVWEDVAFGIMKKGVPPETGRERALQALRLVDAEHLAARAPYRLSGGEKQRAAIASILIMEHEVLLLDEPTASLDPRARRNIITLIKGLDRTRIIASHDLDMILDIADRVIFLHNGELSAQSPVPGLLLDQGYLQSIGLELPLGRTSA
ncbi:MAG: energy-coupling factor ABC transporter ATP-binding protein [Spirochaetaceae bacterium]|nr:energy-coupling factor ABC transporter ATP-binding protein [Spirochaetaceae bacterium]